MKPLGHTPQSERFVDALEFNEAIKERAGPICRELGLGVEIGDIITSRAKRKARPEKSKFESIKEMLEGKKRRRRTEKGEEVPDEYKLAHPERYTTCIICREIVHISQFPKNSPSKTCNHGREVCRMCIIAWIRSQVQDGRLPHCAVCQGTISFDYVETITKKAWDQDIFTR